MILISHRTTRPWSMTMRGRAHWQAASAQLLQAALTETKTMTTLTTGDHASRNWPTCMTHVKTRPASPAVGDNRSSLRCFSGQIWVQDRIWKIKAMQNHGPLVWCAMGFYWGSFGQNWQDGRMQSSVVSTGGFNETGAVVCRSELCMLRGKQDVCWNDRPPLGLFILTLRFLSYSAYKQPEIWSYLCIFSFLYKWLFYKRTLLW